jgi:hypothetical protein
LQQSSIDQGLNYGGDRDTHGVVYGIDVLLIVFFFGWDLDGVKPLSRGVGKWEYTYVSM